MMGNNSILQIHLPEGDQSLPQSVKSILKDYNVSSLSEIPVDAQQIFIYEQGAIKLKSILPNFSKFTPIYIDFEQAWLYHQKTFKKISITGEPLAKALGIKKLSTCPSVLDATCGMGKDSILMLFFKAKVQAIERSPWIALMLADAIRRGIDSSIVELSTTLQENFKLVHGDAISFLNQTPGELLPDIIYLDPMYDSWSHKKRALPNKNMQVFQNLVGSDNDSVQLLETALKAGAQRVVVKRAIHAPELLPGITHSFKGKSTRYDMYS